jgi:hypothetical protein
MKRKSVALSAMLKLQLATGLHISRAKNILKMTLTKPLNQVKLEGLVFFSVKPSIRQCEKCNVGISYSNWALHLKTKKHLLNNEVESDKTE